MSEVLFTPAQVEAMIAERMKSNKAGYNKITNSKTIPYTGRVFNFKEIANAINKVTDELSKVNCAVSILKGCENKKDQPKNLERMSNAIIWLNKEPNKVTKFDLEPNVGVFINHIINCPNEDFLRMALTLIWLVESDNEIIDGKPAYSKEEKIAGALTTELMQIQNRLKYLASDEAKKAEYVFSTSDTDLIAAFLGGEQNGVRIDKTKFKKTFVKK